MTLRAKMLGYNEGLMSLPSELYGAARNFAIHGFSRVPFIGEKTVELILRRKYGAHVITPLKTRNFIQASRDAANKAVEVSSVPYHLNLDPYNVCNLRCRFCTTGTDQQDRAHGKIQLQQAKDIIEAVKDYVITVSLFHWGEPLLHPDIFEMIRYARDAGTATEIHSNLSVKVDDLGARLVDSGLDSLLVSVDGIDQEVNETYRRGANNDLIFENIREIVAAREKAGSTTPRIELAYLVFRHNEHELPRLPALQKDLGVDSLITRKAAIYEESWIPRNPRFRPLQELFEDTCSFLYFDLNVESDLSISPCCINASQKWDVGHADELKQLHRFWNNRKHKAMRAYFAGFGTEEAAEYADEDILCRHCNWVENCRNAPLTQLSPLPPSLAADNVTFAHGIDAIPQVAAAPASTR